MRKRRYSSTRGWDTPSEGTTSSSASSEEEETHYVPRKRVHLDNGQEHRFAHMSIYPSSAPVQIQPDAVEEAESPPVSPATRRTLPQEAEEVPLSTQDTGQVGAVEEPHEQETGAEQGADAMDQSTSRGGWYDLDANRIWVQSLSDSSDSEGEPGQEQEGKYTVLPNVLAKLDRKYRERMARVQAGEEDKALVPYTPHRWPIPPRRPVSVPEPAPGPVPEPAPVPVPEEAMVDDTPPPASVPAPDIDPAYGYGSRWRPNPQYNMPIFGLSPSAYQQFPQPAPASLNPQPPEEAPMELD